MFERKDNGLLLSVDYTSIEFLKNGFILYDGMTTDGKDYQAFYPYSSVKGISCVIEHKNNIDIKNDTFIDNHSHLTKDYYGLYASQDCHFIICVNSVGDTIQEIYVKREFKCPITKLEEIKNPSLIDKIRTYFYFKKVHQKNHLGKFYKISRHSNEEIKEMFEKYDNEFKCWSEELHDFNKNLIQHVIKYLNK